MAQYGYRDHRTDAKQVNIGLSVTGTSGLPMMYELLAGNVADNQTPMGHLDKLKKLFGQVEGLEKRVMVGDRAMLNRKLIFHGRRKSRLIIMPQIAREHNS